ncbi:SDR family oxidoreductase [Bordetella pseudohinzii]|uniref:3-oxoacyl-ACP reductase n=1 Tax=Bordetella pseudohinzii TaxID=1331258 RepID=A0A0J6C063_9BORD|nr:SDR family oxidoreductase [Bordetella pseudohinzii]ANY17296.1 3-oxoacyl-ACP reductase [Bordetella pseudohinzii]KMM24428.1 3-oxoacyl-ACP reductase [Bordetella pseudohinzii]KXA80452.1 3-oxoacyl-ACP reductase [Bordetella pseudohinzii]KXA80753.1 3-oxoacyl-ACP reductase [Bordetella pseudohinzii]CUI68401.1 3-oxoacyl-[acyl-carrier-protein] reductase FabG [Bordetella pseudohinzii]
MDLGISGKRALVCAASKGLGYACAQALAQAGVHLVIVARNEAPLAAAAERLRVSGRIVVEAVAADITAEQGRASALEAAARLPGGARAEFDILVTNAGGPPAGDFRDWDEGVWQAALQANMLTPIALMRATLDGMMSRGWGRICNITSTTVKAPSPYLGLSNGARSGLTGFVAGLARQVAGSGVTINNLLPGTFDTDRLRSNLAAGAGQAAMALDAYTAKRLDGIPARRFGRAEEFGAACAFLCSQQAAYITAQNLLIDGGAYPGTL